MEQKSTTCYPPFTDIKMGRGTNNSVAGPVKYRNRSIKQDTGREIANKNEFCPPLALHLSFSFSPSHFLECLFDLRLEIGSQHPLRKFQKFLIQFFGHLGLVQLLIHLAGVV